jgi:hypothetical protein
MGIIMSRTVGENALLQKHETKRLIEQGLLVKGFPIVDSKNPQHFEEIAGNEYRVFKLYPAGFDFIINIINYAWATGRPGAFFKRIDDNWWKSRINEQTWKKYFAQCGNHTIRQNLAKMVMKDLQTGFIKIAGKDKKGRYISEAPPFRIMERRTYEDGTGYRDIFLNNAVFGSLITMDCKNVGADGFVELPSTLYPLLTGPDTGKLKSHNPIYRLNLFGIIKNTYKKPEIKVSRQVFIENVVPEYLDKDGYLEISPSALYYGLLSNIKAAIPKIPQGLVVKNIYVGKPEGESTIYFKTDN